MDSNPILPGRSCGSCSLCCKLLGIAELEKPEGQWCPHCAPRNGACMIYERRPQECRTFHCQWLVNPALGDAWKPTTAKMVLGNEAGANRLLVHVDAGYPRAWRQEPYFSHLKKAAVHAWSVGRQVVVKIGERLVIVLPDKEIDLGVCRPGDFIETWEAGGECFARKVSAEKPAAY